MSRSHPRRQEFERVALVHLDEIWRYACRLTREPARADDLTQEVFLRAWTSFERFVPDTNCRAWLYGILHNVRKHAWRQLQRDRLTVDLENLPLNVVGYDPPLPRVLDAQLVDEAFAILGEDARELILLADVEGLTYREIATVLGVPVGTVMSRLNRVRKRLRALVAARVHAPAESATVKDQRR